MNGRLQVLEVDNWFDHYLKQRSKGAVQIQTKIAKAVSKVAKVSSNPTASVAIVYLL